MSTDTVQSFEHDTWDVCEDCLQVVAGNEPEHHRLARCLAVIEDQTVEGWVLHPGDETDDLGFSWRSCQLCGDTAAGNRFTVHGLRPI